MNNKFETFGAIISAVMAVMMINLMFWSASLSYASAVFVSVLFFLMTVMCGAVAGAFGWIVLVERVRK
jgi:hypothetical protein